MAKTPDKVNEVDHEGKQLELELPREAQNENVEGGKAPSVMSRIVALEDLVLFLAMLQPFAAPRALTAAQRGALGGLAAQVKRATFDTGWFTTPKGG
jgi:hypothetical protein